MLPGLEILQLLSQSLISVTTMVWLRRTQDFEEIQSGLVFSRLTHLLFVLHLLLFLLLRMQHVAVQIVHWFGSIHEVLGPE